MLAQLFERDDALEAALQLHVHHEPARILRIAVRIVVMMLALEGGCVRVAALHDPHDGRYSRHLAAGVVEEGLIPAPHLIAQHVARLEVAHAVPGAGAAGRRRQVIDAEGLRLRLHQPVAHRLIPSSVTTASMSTSCAAASRCGTSWKA